MINTLAEISVAVGPKTSNDRVLIYEVNKRECPV